MLVKIGPETEADVDFSYELPLEDPNSEKSGRITKVRIVVGKDIVFEGSAQCHPNDRFSRIQGRRRALRRAFDRDKGHAVLSKAARRTICEKVLSAFFPKKESFGVLLDRLLLKETSREVQDLVTQLRRQIYGEETDVVAKRS